MTKHDAQSMVMCPIENTTVDSERCAACGWRGSDHPTCGRDDRVAANDLSFLLRAL